MQPANGIAPVLLPAMRGPTRVGQQNKFLWVSRQERRQLACLDLDDPLAHLDASKFFLGAACSSSPRLHKVLSLGHMVCVCKPLEAPNVVGVATDFTILGPPSPAMDKARLKQAIAASS